jgi:predicted short-subunit dehydrogenase-like oxidoreductase (DUF2520 family)
MGQVPDPSYGIVGDGRLARHFANYFTLLGIPYQSWSRGSSRTSSCAPLQALGSSAIVLVMISDSAIESWIADYKREAEKAHLRSHPLPSQRFVHFSGALNSELAEGVHPLMTFGPDLYELNDYLKIPFVCEEGGTEFKDLFPKLSNPHYTLPKEKKALYHALCVMGGNFTTLLWQKLFADFEGKLGLPHEAAIPYLERITLNLKNNPQSAATGPLARGDQETIRKNLDSLSGDRFRKIYETFVEAHRL